jgi:hypothetical protein
MKELFNYRHGDVALIGAKTMPRLKETTTNVFMSKGSGGNDHTFTGGKFYLHTNDEFIIGYLRAKDTILYHVEHSPKGVKIEDGIYEIRKQVEYTTGGMQEVID